MSDNDVIVLGCSRSGTMWLTDVLIANGYAVEHEQLGRGGGVGWRLLLPECSSWRNTSADVYHIVRDPCDCVLSMATHDSDVFELIDTITGGSSRDYSDVLERATVAWVDLNKVCMLWTDKVVRTEHMLSDCRLHGLDLSEVSIQVTGCQLSDDMTNADRGHALWAPVRGAARVNSRKGRPIYQCVLEFLEERDGGFESLPRWDEALELYAALTGGFER